MITTKDEKHTPPKHELKNKAYIDIANDALAKENPYQLDEKEQNDLRIVLNTLDYIDTNLATLNARKGNARKTIYIDDGTEFAPLHLGGIPKDKGEKYLRENLLNGFVFAYNHVRSAEPRAVKLFCELLSGICIDSRTRSALTFAARKIPTTFTKSMEEASSTIPYRLRDQYFEHFAALLKARWGTPFFKDENNGLCKEAGVFNESNLCINTVKLHLSTKKHLKPGAGFLDTLQHLDETDKPIFLRFVLTHQRILDRIGINPYSSLAKAYSDNNDLKLSAAPASESTLKIFNQCLLSLNWDKLIQSDEDFAAARTLLERANPETCATIIIKYACCANLSLAKKSELLDLYIEKLNHVKQYEPALLKQLCEQTDISGNNILHLVAKLDFSKQFIILAELHKESLSKKNTKQYTPIDCVLDQFNPQLVQWLNDKKIDFIPTSLSLSRCAEHNDEKSFNQYLEAKADINGSVKIRLQENKPSANSDSFSVAVMHNRVNMLEKALPYWKPHASRVSPLICAVYTSSTTPDTIKWLIKQDKIDPNTEHEGKTALLISIAQGDAAKTEVLLSDHRIDLKPVRDALKNIAILHNAEDMLPILTEPELRMRVIKQRMQKNTPEGIQLFIDYYSDCGQKLLEDYPIKKLFDDIPNLYERLTIIYSILDRIYQLMIKKQDAITINAFMKYISSICINKNFIIGNEFDTLPHIAVRVGDLRLLDEYKPVNLNCRNARYENVFGAAIINNFIPALERFINDAQEPHLQSNAKPPVYIAAEYNEVKPETLAWLLQHHIHAETPWGNKTPLQVAIEKNNAPKIILILKSLIKNEIPLSPQELIILKKLNNPEINRLWLPYQLNSVIHTLKNNYSCCYFFAKYSRHQMQTAAEQLQAAQQDEKADIPELAKINPAVTYGEVGEIYNEALKLTK